MRPGSADLKRSSEGLIHFAPDTCYSRQSLGLSISNELSLPGREPREAVKGPVAEEAILNTPAPAHTRAERTGPPDPVHPISASPDVGNTVPPALLGRLLPCAVSPQAGSGMDLGCHALQLKSPELGSRQPNSNPSPTGQHPWDLGRATWPLGQPLVKISNIQNATSSLHLLFPSGFTHLGLPMPHGVNVLVFPFL